jgi:poly-gamma-glutamate capsule biosynthesis protein CapA/YwtB (metallophosphatase superfamily)
MKKTVILIIVVLFFGNMLFSCKKKKEMTIAAGGDLVVARGLDREIEKHGDEYPFIHIRDHLKKADLTFANLESVVADNAELRSKDPKKINYNAPSSVMGVLVKSGFNVFSIANNHIFDLGKDGISEFKGLLDKTDILYGGAGMNHEEASKPLTLKVKGLNVAFLFYNSTGGLNHCAGKKKAGYNCMPIKNMKKALQILKKDLKKVKKTDYKILTLHWGDNYKSEPTDDMIEFAHKAIDMGVDLILGHSSHIFHGIEIYKNKPILYDMGDIYLVKSGGWDTRSFLFNINVKDGKTESVELFPTYIKNNQVLPAEGKTAEENINRFIDLSKKFNTEMRVENNRIIIDIPQKNQGK